MLGMLDAMDKRGIEATFVLLWPDREHHRIEKNYQSIRIKYLWKDLSVLGKYFYFERIFDNIYYHIAYTKFRSSLKEGDKVYLYGANGWLKDFINLRGVDVYHEETESPLVLPLETKKAQQQYLNVCTKVKGLFVISTALKKFYASIGVDEKIISIVNMTVDPSRFLKLKKNTGKEKYIVYCGNGANNKDGVDELIKAFAITHQKHSDVKLYIIGPMPNKDDESGNFKLIDDLDLKDVVVFKGIQPARAIPQILKDATICALDRPDSLQAQNGFPTKLGEYLLSETPVVVTKVGDIPLFLKDGESAMLAEERNPQEFSAKMNWLLEHPQQAYVIGKRGAAVAMEEFNSEIETDKIINVINKL